MVRGTQLVQEACRRHETSPTAGAALGRALLGTLLMAAFREEGEKTQVGVGVWVLGGVGAGGWGREWVKPPSMEVSSSTV